MTEKDSMTLTNGVNSSSVTVSVPVCGFEGGALCLPVTLRLYPHLWSQVVGSDQKNKVKCAGSKNDKVVALLCLSDRARSLAIWEHLKRKVNVPQNQEKAV